MVKAVVNLASSAAMRRSQASGQREARAGRRAGDHRQRRLGHLVQPAADFHARAQVGHLVVEGHGDGRTCSVLGETLHVAAGAEGRASTGEHHQAHGRVVGQARQRLGQGVHHLARKRVARFRPVHGECGDAALNVFEQVLGHVVLLVDWLGWLCNGVRVCVPPTVKYPGSAPSVRDRPDAGGASAADPALNAAHAGQRPPAPRPARTPLRRTTVRPRCRTGRPAPRPAPARQTAPGPAPRWRC